MVRRGRAARLTDDRIGRGWASESDAARANQGGERVSNDDGEERGCWSARELKRMDRHFAEAMREAIKREQQQQEQHDTSNGSIKPKRCQKLTAIIRGG
jgi:hypothetical protein